MASSLALKRLLSSAVVPKSLRPTASRLFNTNAVREYDGDDHPRGDLDRPSSHHRSLSRRDDFLSDVFDPFSPTRSLSQVLNLMDHLMDNPFAAATAGQGAAGVRRGWEAKETEEALHLRIDMPGLGKEEVKVSVEQNTLTISGEEGSKEEGGSRRYMSRIDLPEKLYLTDQIKAEMKNGVLKVVVPKVKEDQRADVFHVNVD